jgi:hypothetical protein
MFAAAEVKIKLPLGAVPTSAVRVVADDFYTKNAQDQLQMSWSRHDDELTVNFVSPAATMEPLQLRFSVVLSPGNIFTTDPAGPSINSVKFYDLNGYLMTTAEDSVPAASAFTIGIE